MEFESLWESNWGECWKPIWEPPWLRYGLGRAGILEQPYVLNPIFILENRVSRIPSVIGNTESDQSATKPSEQYPISASCSPHNLNKPVITNQALQHATCHGTKKPIKIPC